MTKNRVKASANANGLYFDGEKRWLNNTVGYGYEIYIPNRGFCQADTLDGIYRFIMESKSK